MKFQLVIPAEQDVFQELFLQQGNQQGSYYFLPCRSLQAGSKLEVKTFKPSEKCETYFRIGSVQDTEETEDEKESEPVGFLFFSLSESQCIGGTSIIAKSVSNVDYLIKSWKKGNIENMGTRLVMKGPNFYVFHMPNVATLISNPKTSSKLHESLTTL